jgi:hypothetical protein
LSQEKENTEKEVQSIAAQSQQENTAEEMQSMAQTLLEENRSKESQVQQQLRYFPKTLEVQEHRVVEHQQSMSDPSCGVSIGNESIVQVPRETVMELSCEPPKKHYEILARENDIKQQLSILNNQIGKDESIGIVFEKMKNENESLALEIKSLKSDYQLLVSEKEALMAQLLHAQCNQSSNAQALVPSNNYDNSVTPYQTPDSTDSGSSPMRYALLGGVVLGGLGLWYGLKNNNNQ